MIHDRFDIPATVIRKATSIGFLLSQGVASDSADLGLSFAAGELGANDTVRLTIRLSGGSRTPGWLISPTLTIDGTAVSVGSGQDVEAHVEVLLAKATDEANVRRTLIWHQATSHNSANPDFTEIVHTTGGWESGFALEVDLAVETTDSADDTLIPYVVTCEILKGS